MEWREPESGRELGEAKADYYFGGTASHHSIHKGTPVDFGVCRDYLMLPRSSNLKRNISE